MADAPITFNSLQAFQIHAQFAAQIPLNHIFTLLDGMNDLGQLLFGEVFSPNLRIDGRLLDNGLGINRAETINVAEGNVDPLLAWNVNT